MQEISKEASRWFQLLAVLVFSAEASNIKGQRQVMPMVSHPIDGGCVMYQGLGWFIISSGNSSGAGISDVWLWSIWEKDETESCLVSIK